MSVRKRTWVTKGEERTAWVVDYRDQGDVRRLKTFDRKKDAEAFANQTAVDVAKGLHVADRASCTIAEAAELWMQSGKDAGLERSTLRQARSHVDLHIRPFIGATRLNKLTVPGVRAFATRLRDEGRSAPMVRKVLTSLSGIVSNAMEAGLASHNPVRESSQHNRSKRHGKATQRDVKRLEVGVDIPTHQEVRAVLEAASRPGDNKQPPSFRRALFMTFAMAGLRASELRGLRWQDVDLDGATITVRQRADAWGVMGPPKSKAGTRSIPIPAPLATALKEWRLACPRADRGQRDAAGNPVKELWLVFANSEGKPYSHGNLVQRHWWPVQEAAGMATRKLDKAGNPVMEPDDDGELIPALRAKYSGLHALRHFFCSWCAARVQDGGLGLQLQQVQRRMGHAKLATTSSRYLHLFPTTDDSDVLAAGASALLGS